MPYGLPDEMPLGGDDEEESPESGAEPGDDPEVARLASEAFPGVEVNASALKALLRHCMDKYGGGAEEPEAEEPMPAKGKGLLIAAFGKPKTEK